MGHMLATLVHHSRLMTWLVQTIGRSLAILIAPSVVAAFLVVDLPLVAGLLWFGSLLAFLIYITTVRAPLPDDDVLEMMRKEGH